MTTVRQPLRWNALWRGLIDPRNSRQIDDEITAELEFHLEQAQAEWEARGNAPAEARRMALQQFGDFEAIRRACRREQTRTLHMIRRLHLFFTLALLVTVGVLSWSGVQTRRLHANELQARMEESLHFQQRMLDLEAAAWLAPREIAALAVADETSRAPVPAGAVDPAVWRARFAEQPGDWRHGLRAAYDLAALDDERVVQVARAIWGDMSTLHKEQFFKPFVFEGGRPCAVQLLELGAKDEAPSVRQRADVYLCSYAFQEFATNPAGRDAWFARFAQAPAAEAVRQSAREFALRLAGAVGNPLQRDLELVREVRPEIAQTLGVSLGRECVDAGLDRAVLRWIGDPTLEQRAGAVRLLGWMAHEEPALRAELIRAAEHDDSELAATALVGLGRPGADWAVRPLEDWLARHVGDASKTNLAFSAALSLAEIGDPSVVERLVEIMRADRSGTGHYAIGHFGLSRLTGVAYDRSHDVAWWENWLAENPARTRAQRLEPASGGSDARK